MDKIVTNISNEAEVFFKYYEDRVNKALSGSVDVEGTANAFADFFIEANPFGVQCGKNDEQFRAQIPKGLEYYKSIGTVSMKVEDLTTTRLDEFHAMVSVHWKALYNKKDGNEEIIEFDVIYFLQTINQQLKIFAYITGDEQGVLKERGII